MMATQQSFNQSQRPVVPPGSALGGFAAHYPVGTSVPPIPISTSNENNTQNTNGSQSSNSNNTAQTERPPPVIDLKVILSKDEVAYVFGFDGVLIAQLRQQTGANVGITQGDSHEYVLCIGGSIEVIFKAFSLVCRKLWDFLTGVAGGPGHDLPLTLRLAVPASQCGSIIGKQGAKVKEIRDLTGAVIQVSQESFPDSTEREVEIKGNGEACLQSTYHICVVMQETPLRGEVIPYIPGNVNQRNNGFGMSNANQSVPNAPPDNNWRPVFLCGDKAYVIEGNVARPAPPELLRHELAKTPLGGDVAESLARRAADAANSHHRQNGQEHNGMPDHMNPLALMAAISKSQRNGETVNRTSREMPVNTELIRKVFLKDSSSSELSQNRKLEEIQKMSGAQIHMPDSTLQQQSEDESSMTTLTISGSEDSILLAQFLVQSNIDMIIKQERLEARQRDFKGPEGFNFGPNFHPNQPPFGPFNGPPGFMGPPNMMGPPGGPRPLMDQGMPPLMQPHMPPHGPPPEGFGPMGFGPRGRGGPFFLRGPRGGFNRGVFPGRGGMPR